LNVTSTIQITDKARRELKKLGAEGDSFLRITVISGGCSGMTYSASIDSTLNQNDQVIFQDNGLRVISDPDSTHFLSGLEVDYSDDLVQSGFRFKNPLAKKACGCGSSFAI
jgi:iron-sulfur cluster assembly protein